MKKNQAFSPFIQITSTGDQVAVMFDSDLIGDDARTARVVFVPKNSIQQLSWAVALPEGEGTSALSVYLVVGQNDGQQVRHELGAIGVVADESVVREAVARAFHFALVAYLQGERAAASPASPVASERYQSWAPALGKGGHQSPRPFSPFFTKPLAAFGLVGVLVLAVAAGISTWNGGRMDPIQAAVAQNMAQDPASIMAQVELTKETLRQMGLDPGRGGDLGCLAPEQ